MPMLLILLNANGQTPNDHPTIWNVDDVHLCLPEVSASLLQLVGMHNHTIGHDASICGIWQISCILEIG